MNRKTTVEEERFCEIVRHVENRELFAEFMAFCMERLNADENASVEKIWAAWCESRR